MAEPQQATETPDFIPAQTAPDFIPAERSAASPIAPPQVTGPRISMHPSFLIGDPNVDATPTPAGDVAKGMGRNLYQVSAPGIASSFSHDKAPGVLSKVPLVGSAMERNAAPTKRLPSQILENGALMMLPGAEGEAGEIAPETVSSEVAPRPATSASSAAPGVVSRLGGLAGREIRSHVPFFGRSVPKPTFEDVSEAIHGPTPEPAPAPIPETNGIQWGKGGPGPLDLRGKYIPPEPPVYPGAHLPDNPGVFPGARFPETPAPEVLQANSLARGPERVADPAAALEQVPVRGRAGAMVRSIAEPKITTAPVDTGKLGGLLNEGLEGNIPEGHTAVKSSAIRSYKYDPATREFEASTPGGTYIHGDVSPEQAKDFENASSKGKAWTELKNNSTYVGKIVNGKRVSAKPPRDLGFASPDDLTPQLQKSLDAARKARTARIANPR